MKQIYVLTKWFLKGNLNFVIFYRKFRLPQKKFKNLQEINEWYIYNSMILNLRNYKRKELPSGWQLLSST